MAWKKENTAFEQLLALEDGSTKHKLSAIYKILLDLDMKPNTTYLEKWERDCNTTFTQQTWDTLFSSCLTSTNITPLKLQSIKLLYRWYTTPAKLYKLKLTPNNLCWKVCNQCTDYMHCWWHCPPVNSFWWDVGKIITDMKTCKVNFSPAAFLLNLWPEDDIPKYQEKSVSLLLSLANTEIASKWKSRKPPDLLSWYNRIWKSFLLSKITDRLLSTTTLSYHSILESTWLPILGYLAQNNIISSKYSDITFLIF